MNTGRTSKFVDEVRETRYQRWSGKRLFARGLLLYLSLVGVVGLGQFVLMESVKNPSFSLGTCQTLLRDTSDPTARSTVIDDCREAFGWQIQQADWASRVNGWLGWVNPLTGPIYGSFFSVNQANLRFEQNLFEVAANAKPYVATVKNATVPWTYDYKVTQTPESDVGKFQAMTAQMQAQGYHVKDSYEAKVNGIWMTVVLWEKVNQGA